MLTIMKYETIRQRLSKFIMLGLLAVLEVVFLISLYGQMDKPMGYAIVGLTFLAIFSFMYVSVESILNYNQDLSKKSGYMLFMTPHSVYEILGAKIIHNILTIILTALVFGLVAFLDIMLILLKAFDIGFFDWVLLCNAGFDFFPRFYPECKPVLGHYLFGYNWKTHLAHVIAFFPISALIAWICTLF